jgi:hypothetical protein
MQPLPIRARLGNRLFQLFIADNATFLSIDQEHAPRLQPLLDEHAFGWHVQHTHLRGHDHQIIFGDVVTRRPQPIAVEHCPNPYAIREGN